MGLIKKSVLFGIGLVSQAEEKLESFSQEMVKKGEVAQQQAKKMMENRLAASRRKQEQAEKGNPESLRASLAEANLATREDLQKLEQRISALEAKMTKSSRS